MQQKDSREETSGQKMSDMKKKNDKPKYIKYAKRFNIKYFDKYKLIEINNPWPDTDKNFKYILYKRGKQRPNGYEDARYIKTPVKKLVSLSSTSLGFAIELEILDKLVAVNKKERITHKGVLKRINNGDIKEVGSNQNVNIEMLMEMAPVLVSTYGVGDPKYDSHPKLTEAGIPVAIHAEYMETSPLGRAEWIKFLAAFFNKRKKAKEVFEKIEKK
ncbi:MAG: ABC transporter substrate-binding protein [Flavobacteriales bacterium]